MTIPRGYMLRHARVGVLEQDIKVSFILRMPFLTYFCIKSKKQSKHSLTQRKNCLKQSLRSDERKIKVRSVSNWSSSPISPPYTILPSNRRVTENNGF